MPIPGKYASSSFLDKCFDLRDWPLAKKWLNTSTLFPFIKYRITDGVLVKKAFPRRIEYWITVLFYFNTGYRVEKKKKKMLQHGVSSEKKKKKEKKHSNALIHYHN
jgi:hypothetical protein